MLLLRLGVLRKTKEAAAKQGKHIPLDGYASPAGAVLRRLAPLPSARACSRRCSCPSLRKTFFCCSLRCAALRVSSSALRLATS